MLRFNFSKVNFFFRRNKGGKAIRNEGKEKSHSLETKSIKWSGVDTP
jgi:hypothetical protein